MRVYFFSLGVHQSFDRFTGTIIGEAEAEGEVP